MLCCSLTGRILHSALSDTFSGTSVEKNNHRKRNSESHTVQNVSSMPLSMTAVLEGSFPNFNLTCKESSVHYSLLIDMFGKAEMRWKGTCFDRRVKTLKCEWVGIIAHINRPISVKARNNFRSFYNGSVMKLKYLHLNKLFLSSPFIQARLY